MSDFPSTMLQTELAPTAGEHLSREIAILADRLARLLADAPVASDTAVAAGIAFLRAVAQPAAGESSFAEHLAIGIHDRSYPLGRLATTFSFAPVEADLILLAGMAEEHEGFASLFRTLHPRGEPRPTIGLAAQLLCASAAERLALRDLLVTGAATRSGALVLADDGPFFERSLLVADSLWPALAGIDAWPAFVRALDVSAAPRLYAEWLSTAAVAQARTLLRRGAPALIVVVGDDQEGTVRRAAAVAAAAHVPAVAVGYAAGAPNAVVDRLIPLHAVARGVVPIVRVAAAADGSSAEPLGFGAPPGPMILCARDGAVTLRGERPVLKLGVERISARARAGMWRDELPALERHAPMMGACYAVEPHVVVDVAADVRERAAIDDRPYELHDVAAAIRARAQLTLAAGVRLVHPTARWEGLVLPRDRRRQLQEALDRLMHQGRVLDDWGFLAGRPGARGVRLMFAGPPGTGKTLAAEVLAHALRADLLIVDLSRVVSKWIGETEKNLAEVFDAAERTQAVLLFDEADALFGKRTEVSDAHDRYANLETAYLLSRLERFDGLAILSTNLRENIDPAFTRRLEFVVDFDEPSLDEREALWRCHLPAGAPIADDVSVAELASLYPIVGGLIRNAAVAAGFLASAADSAITRNHLVRAVRREYEKLGRAFPGAPAGSFTS
jgi:ATPase family protein associated with various cellular activities (AAA)/winged helix domain-containing protein